MQKWEYCFVHTLLLRGHGSRLTPCVHTVNGLTLREIDEQKKIDIKKETDESKERDEPEELTGDILRISIPDAIEMHDFANQLGEEGWELIKIEKQDPEEEGDRISILWVFKRPKP